MNILYVDPTGKRYPAQIVGEPKEYSATFKKAGGFYDRKRKGVDLNVNFGSAEFPRWSPIINACQYSELFNTSEKGYYEIVEDKPKVASTEKGK